MFIQVALLQIIQVIDYTSYMMLFLAAHCLFAPPPDWEIADPKMPQKRAVVSFVAKNKRGFCPSMNLTHEKTKVSMKEYLAIVEKNAKAKKQKWLHLGQIQTQSGKAELTQIEVKTKFGETRIFQAILKMGEDIFILTASALKKDFGKHAPSLEKAISSMHIVNDLFSLVLDEKIQTALREAWQKKKEGVESESFNKMVLENDLGPVWKLEILKE
jgi:hypothetical protein